jgi:hypothetical protein
VIRNRARLSLLNSNERKFREHPEVTGKRAGVECGACGAWADERAGSIPFYLKRGEISTTLWKCRGCGTYIREANYEDPAIQGHFEVSSYTNTDKEQYWRSLRTGFFKYILEVAALHLGRSMQGVRGLDFGTAYGVFMELLAQQGGKPEGVEIVPALRKLALDRGITVHRDIQGLKPGSYDLVTAIDSFYYLNDPHTSLVRLGQALDKGGIVILRLTNRTWYFNAVRALGRPVTQARFDDIKYNYSVAGARRLLGRSGFEVERIYWSDRGRGDIRPLAAAYYKFSPLLAKYLSIHISPGMIIVARPATRD